MAKSKRVSVNYGDLSEDVLKYATSVSTKPSPKVSGRKTMAGALNPGGSMSANTSPYLDGVKPQKLKNQRSFNDDALARLSGTADDIDTLKSSREILASLGPQPQSNDTSPVVKQKRSTYVSPVFSPNLVSSQLKESPNLDKSKRHSVSNYIPQKPRPVSIQIKKNNRYSAFDGSEHHKQKLVRQMLSPIDTSGSESFSPVISSGTTGLGLDSVLQRGSPVTVTIPVPRKVKDIDDDDDDELSPVFSKNPASPNYDLNPFRSLDKPVERDHTRSKSINFHSRNRSMTVKHAEPIASPLVNITPNATFDDIASEYPHCIPVHTSSKKSLLSLSKFFPGNKDASSKLKGLSMFGIKNLVIMLFVINNFGLLLEYYKEYANMSSVHSIFFMFRYSADVQFFMVCLCLTPIYYIYTYTVEKTLYLLTKKKFNSIVRNKFSASALSENPSIANDEVFGLGKSNLSFRLTNTILQPNYLIPVFALLYLSAVSLVFAINNLIIIKFIYNPILGTVLELHTLICVFKIVSFALTNKCLRELYFKSINVAKYSRYLKNRKHLVSDDGTLNVTKVSKNVDPLLSGRMTGTQMVETINTLKQVKGSHEVQEEETFEDVDSNFVDQNLQPEFYKGNQYPHNVTVREIFYFSCIPTLIYQPVYPRKAGINWRYCVDKVIEIAMLSSLIYYLSSSFAIPILKDSILDNFNPNIQSVLAGGPLSSTAKSTNTSNIYLQLKLIEILIKLADVSILIWLISYYLIFHNYLNLLAELCKFDDCDFYYQWWNSGSIGGYWKNWNKLFYDFFQRHFYKPVLSNGPEDHSSNRISFMMFFLMAVMQELVVGIPTGNMMGISFVCIIMQSPLSVLTNPIDNLGGDNSTIGNIIFWVSFIIGQPLCILLYYFTWNIKYGELSSY